MPTSFVCVNNYIIELTNKILSCKKNIHVNILKFFFIWWSSYLILKIFKFALAWCVWHFKKEIEVIFDLTSLSLLIEPRILCLLPRWAKKMWGVRLKDFFLLRKDGKWSKKRQQQWEHIGRMYKVCDFFFRHQSASNRKDLELNSLTITNSTLLRSLHIRIVKPAEKEKKSFILCFTLLLYYFFWK